MPISGELRVSSVAACEARCEEQPLCTAYDTDGRSCYLKSRCAGRADICSGWCGYRQRQGAPSVCMLVARWGQWPPWTPLLLRALATNTDVRWTLMGDTPPTAQLPSNVGFSEWPMPRLLARLRQAIGFSAGRLEQNDHSTSKISDLKPTFGVSFPELLRGCDWWGNMQDDVLPGRLSDWATPSVLSLHDVVSPLPRPFASCGPLMLYRNVRGVNNLFRRSGALWRVLSDERYLVFDEWWGPLRGDANMANVTATEAESGRLRLFHGGVDRRKRGNRKSWGWEDRLYDRKGGVRYDEALVLTWSSGVLWQGPGPALGSTAAAGARARARRDGSGFDAWREGAGFMLAFAHLIDTKRRAALAQLGGLERLQRLAPTCEHFSLSAHGLWLQLPSSSRKGGRHGHYHHHLWFSGLFPKVYAVVRSMHLRANLSRLSLTLSGTRVAPNRVAAFLPCVVDVKLAGNAREACALYCRAGEPCDIVDAFSAAVGARPCARRSAHAVNCSSASAPS